MLFPKCGIDIEHLEIVKGMTKRDAAKKLGISERQFYSVIKEHGFCDMFVNTKNRPCKVDKEDIIDLAQQGFIRRDVAFMLDISPHYLKDLIAKWNLAGYFTVSKGRAAYVSRCGYVDI